MVHVVLSYPPWSPTACFTFQQCYRFSRTLVNVMGECFANGILQWCGKVWNWGNQNESKQPILYSDIWEQFLITQNCTNIMIFLRVSHMRGKQHCSWALTLLWLCHCSLVPSQREGESHHLHMCLIVVEFHWHCGPSIYVCTLSSSPQAFIVGPPLEIWDHFLSWIFHFLILGNLMG